MPVCHPSNPSQVEVVNIKQVQSAMCGITTQHQFHTLVLEMACNADMCPKRGLQEAWVYTLDIW